MGSLLGEIIFYVLGKHPFLLHRQTGCKLTKVQHHLHTSHQRSALLRKCHFKVQHHIARYDITSHLT